MDFSTIKALHDQHVMNTYGRSDVAFVKGEGCVLYDAEDKAYLDFSSGIGVNSIGYAHPKWVKAVAEQAAALAHTSNLFYTVPGAQLAQKLAQISGMKNVFFANSGAEANEGMIKLARKYSFDKYGKDRATIITLRNSFHGRTLTTLAATGQDKFHTLFFPFPQGFAHVEAGSLEALSAMGNDVCAVMLEVVQGEGGVLPIDLGYLQAVQTLCAQRDWLLLCDEVQTGIGRCGTWFAFQQAKLSPDVVSFAKGVAGGLPLGGILANEKCSAVLTPGTHATTFGGNPICCAAGVATLDILSEFLPQVEAKGAFLREALSKLPGVVEVRGQGLMLGMVVTGNPADIIKDALSHGLVCLTAGKDVVRMLPPLVISMEELQAGIDILANVILNHN